MRWSFSVSTSRRTNNRWQAYVLLMLGVIFLMIAWLDLLNAYPTGELFFGLGILAASPLNTHRFLAAGWLITLIGLAGFLIFGHTLPVSQLLAVHVLAIGMGFLGIRWMTRRGDLSTETLTPSLLVLGVGVVEYLQAAHLTPAHFLSFALSLWLPGFGLLVLGLLSLAMSGRAELKAKCQQAVHTETHVPHGTEAIHSGERGLLNRIVE